MMVTMMLVLVLLLGSGMVTCRDTSPDLTSTVIQYSDTCQYSEDYYRCGDRCTRGYNDCECGNTIIELRRDAQQCCVPAEDSKGRRGEGVVTDDRHCSQKDWNSNVKCAGGVVTGIHDLCHSRCYNSYIDSTY